MERILCSHVISIKYYARKNTKGQFCISPTFSYQENIPPHQPIYLFSLVTFYLKKAILYSDWNNELLL